jgi:membrane-associated phospholipid phosphatase
MDTHAGARPTSDMRSLAPIPDVAARVPVPAPVSAAVSPGEAARRATRLLPIAAVATGGFGFVFIAVKTRRTGPIDLDLTRLMQRLTPRPVASALHAASWPGYPPQSRIIPPALAAAWLAVGLPAEAVCQAAGWGTAVVSELVKAVARRPRPIAPEVTVVVAPLGGSSFPSGHVLTYTGVYGTAAYLLAGRLRGRWRTAAVAPLVLVGLVGPSRIQQGHHWPTDVTASYLLGSAYVTGIVALHRRLVRFEAARRPATAGR